MGMKKETILNDSELVPTQKEREMVEKMSGFGVPTEQIASLIRDSIDNETLIKHFSKELQTGKAKANSRIGQTLFQKAMDGDTAAMIWWSKSQMRWSGVERLEHTSPDGSMTPVAGVVHVYIPDNKRDK